MSYNYAHACYVEFYTTGSPDLFVEIIITFSVKPRSHFLDRVEYAEAFLSIPQLTQKILPSCLRFQIYLDSSVRFPYFSCLKLIKWFAYQCLKGVSVKPMYISGDGCHPFLQLLCKQPCWSDNAHSADTVQVCGSFSAWAVRCPPVRFRIYGHCVA